jgi:hypothetical protein
VRLWNSPRVHDYARGCRAPTQANAAAFRATDHGPAVAGIITQTAHPHRGPACAGSTDRVGAPLRRGQGRVRTVADREDRRPHPTPCGLGGVAVSSAAGELHWLASGQRQADRLALWLSNPPQPRCVPLPSGAAGRAGEQRRATQVLLSLDRRSVIGTPIKLHALGLRLEASGTRAEPAPQATVSGCPRGVTRFARRRRRKIDIAPSWSRSARDMSLSARTGLDWCYSARGIQSGPRGPGNLGGHPRCFPAVAGMRSVGTVPGGNEVSDTVCPSLAGGHVRVGPPA